LRQAVVGEHLAVVGHQTVAQHRQFGAEGVGAGIGIGAEPGGARGRGPGDALVGRRQPGVDLGQGAAIRLVGAVRAVVLRRPRQGRHLGRDMGEAARQAQLGAERIHLFEVIAQHRPRGRRQRRRQGLAIDIGIAVAVAADPGPDADEGIEVGRVQRLAPLLQLLRRDPQEDAVEEGDDGVDLVLHHKPRGPHQPRRPQDHRLAPQSPIQHVRCAGQIILVAGVQQVRHRRDPVDDALAPHLRRVSRQDGRDQAVVQQVARIGRRLARRRQPGHGPLQRIGSRAFRGLGPRPALAGPVLGDIGQKREDREAVG